jgi:hypothetical protein
MATDVPILAYAAAAVPETLGGAGVQFSPKDLEQAAELAGALVFDQDFRAGVIAGQRRRLQDFSEARTLGALTGVLESLQRGASPPPRVGEDVARPGARGPRSRP